VNSEALTYSLESKEYKVTVHSRHQSRSDTVKIIIPVYLFNEESFRISEVCIESVINNTPENHEIWVVDNNSTNNYSKLLNEIIGINLIANHTEPIDPLVNLDRADASIFGKMKNLIMSPSQPSQLNHGAYANAVGLELGCNFINQDTKLVFTMHSDTLVLKKGWLSFLMSKLNDKVRAVACWTDIIRVNALHIGGLLFDYSLFRSLNMDFLPNIGKSRYPDMPEYDVGDLITLKLLENGYDHYSCKNTYNDPSLVEIIPDNHPLKNIHSDRCFDEEGELFFAHMGRGTPKSRGTYKQKGKTYPKEWIQFAEDYVL
jgi:glycosyltransferase involved in cell wall biosynthesis